MTRILTACLLIPLSASAQTLAESIRALIDEYENSVRANTQKIIAATSEEERASFRASVPSAAPCAEKVLRLIEASPDDPGGAAGVAWLVTQAGGLPQGARALEMLGTTHVRSAGIAAAVKALEHQPSALALPLLKTLRERNPHPEEQAAAAYATGVHHFRRYENAASEEERAAAKEEAMAAFQEVAARHAGVSIQGFPLADQAGRMLFELGNLSVGDPAPAIEGADLDGGAFTLKDHLGKHVVLVFWGGWCHACHGVMPQVNEFSREHQEKAVVLGINTDIPAEARKAMSDFQISFRNWSDGATSGPITSMFNLRGFPTIHLIGPDGRIVLKNTHLAAIREHLARH